MTHVFVHASDVRAQLISTLEFFPALRTRMEGRRFLRPAHFAVGNEIVRMFRPHMLVQGVYGGKDSVAELARESLARIVVDLDEVVLEVDEPFLANRTFGFG